MKTAELYLRELKEFNAQLEVLSKAVTELPELPEWAHLYSPSIVHEGFRIDIPYNLEMRDEIIKLLINDWGMISTGKVYDDNLRVIMKHRSTKMPMEIFLLSKKEGSTCERVQVGVKEEPIWEVRCE